MSTFKKDCKNCRHYVKSCSLQLKNNYNGCRSYSAKQVSEITEEIRKLKISGSDPKKLELLQSELDFFYYGIQLIKNQ